MTREQINIAIAEACGLPVNVCKCGDSIESHRQGHNEHGFDSMLDGPPPNYCGDLNAMHEAEKVLIGSGATTRYIFELQTICGGEFFGQNYFATSSQRAEAFLRTIGKWTATEEGK